jgi:hypothetical protein
MFPNWAKPAFAAGIVTWAGLAVAAPKPLIDPVSGTSSGWQWEVSDAQAPLVNLVFIRSEGNNFFFEKDAEFQPTTDVLTIQFSKIAGVPTKTLVINDEAILNNTGSDWSGFRMVLSSGAGTPNFAFMTSDSTPGVGDFRLDPFTAFQFQNFNSELDLTGGTVKAGANFFPGSQSKTGLAIIANGNSDTFVLKEIPLIGIPLPLAAWTGLSTLMLLGAVGGAKRLRSRV